MVEAEDIAALIGRSYGRSTTMKRSPCKGSKFKARWRKNEDGRSGS